MNKFLICALLALSFAGNSTVYADGPFPQGSICYENGGKLDRVAAAQIYGLFRGEAHVGKTFEQALKHKKDKTQKYCNMDILGNKIEDEFGRRLIP